MKFNSVKDRSQALTARDTLCGTYMGNHTSRGYVVSLRMHSRPRTTWPGGRHQDCS